jgi:hypothetical protein
VTASTELARALLTALDAVPGVRAATPTAPGRVPWDWDLLAVDVDPDQVCVRLVATRLPLPPVLTAAERILRTVLDTSDRPRARLRIEVTDIDRAAFTTRDADHPIGS